MNKLTFALTALMATTAVATANTLDVTAYGADNTGVRPAHEDIRKAVNAAKPGDVVFFPRGTYFLRGLIWIGDKKGITLRGERGTVIKMHCNPYGAEGESSGAFHLHRCEDVALEKFTITTDNPIGCVGRVLAKDEQAHTLDYRIDDPFPATGEEHFFQLNTCDDEGTPDGAIETHHNIEKATNAAGKVVYRGFPYETIGDRTVRIQLPKWAALASVTNGHRMLVRYFRNGEGPLVVEHSRRTRVEDVEVERTPSTGCVIAPPSEDIVLRRFSIRPRADDPHVCASNSDGIHFVGCSGSVILEDCHFKGLGDDALNVHSLGAEVKDYDPATRSYVFMRRNTENKESAISPYWATAGDPVAVYDPKTLAKRGTVTLSTWEKGKGTLAEGSIELHPGDYLANAHNYPTVRISGCSFENTRARAVLLQTQKVLVENCSFWGLKSSALLLACDMAFWHEMGPFEDVTVTNCTFRKCSKFLNGHHALGTLAVRAKHDGGPTDYPAGVHRNLRIVGNTFDDVGSSAIYVEATDGVEIRDNSFSRWGQDPKPTPESTKVVRLQNCKNVTGGGNVKK